MEKKKNEIQKLKEYVHKGIQNKGLKCQKSKEN